MGMTRAELIELLKKARKQLKKYHVPKNEQTVTLSIDTLESALSEQPQIIRCKDCIYWDKGHTEECDNSDSVCFHNGWCKPDWFCADGEKRDE